MLPCCSVDIRLVRWLLKKAAYGFTIESKFKRIPVRIPAWFLRLWDIAGHVGGSGSLL